MTDDLAFFSRVPFYWEGALAPLTQPHSFVHVASTLARSFGAAASIDDEDRRLVHARVSVDAPRGDRVWLRFRKGTTMLSLAEALQWLQAQGADVPREGLSKWCSALELDLEHAFELAPREFHARCLPHYRGFLHAWTDEHTARDHYLTWPPGRQAEFAHEYLLYAANDVSAASRLGGGVDEGLQRAAEWLQSHRRFIVQWTLVLSEDALQPSLPSQAAYCAALEELIDAAPREEGWAVHLLSRIRDSLYAPATALTELEQLLQRLGCDEGRLQSLHFWENARALEQVSFNPGAEAERLKERALRWCELARRWGW